MTATYYAVVAGRDSGLIYGAGYGATEDLAAKAAWEDLASAVGWAEIGGDSVVYPATGTLYAAAQALGGDIPWRAPETQCELARPITDEFSDHDIAKTQELYKQHQERLGKPRHVRRVQGWISEGDYEIPCGTDDDPHQGAYTGQVPGTGPVRCIFCGAEV